MSPSLGFEQVSTFPLRGLIGSSNHDTRSHPRNNLATNSQDFASSRARGGAEWRAGFGPSFGLRGRRFSFWEIGCGVGAMG